METYVDGYGQGGFARQDRKMDGRNSSCEAFCRCDPAHIVPSGLHDLVLGLGKS